MQPQFLSTSRRKTIQQILLVCLAGLAIVGCALPAPDPLSRLEQREALCARYERAAERIICLNTVQLKRLRLLRDIERSQASEERTKPAGAAGLPDPLEFEELQAVFRAVRSKPDGPGLERGEPRLPGRSKKITPEPPPYPTTCVPRMLGTMTALACE